MKPIVLFIVIYAVIVGAAPMMLPLGYLAVIKGEGIIPGNEIAARHIDFARQMLSGNVKFYPKDIHEEIDLAFLRRGWILERDVDDRRSECDEQMIKQGSVCKMAG